MKLLKTKYGAPDRPLRIGEIEIPCYVLEGGTRVIVQAGMVKGLGMRPKTSVREFGKFIDSKSIKPFISKELEASAKLPVKFQSPTGPAYGYEATILSDICIAIIQSKRAGKLYKSQEHIGDRAERLILAFAKTGIIALIDEATGYQETRPKDELQNFIKRYISPELRPWEKTFPDEYYEEIFRLNGWALNSGASRFRPGVVGKWTTDIIYDRMPPGVKDELYRLTPRDGKGRLANRLHQHLSDDLGYPSLKSFVSQVIALMKAAPHWNAFKVMLQRAFPKNNSNLELPLDDVFEE